MATEAKKLHKVGGSSKLSVLTDEGMRKDGGRMLVGGGSGRERKTILPYIVKAGGFYWPLPLPCPGPTI